MCSVCGAMSAVKPSSSHMKIGQEPLSGRFHNLCMKQSIAHLLSSLWMTVQSKGTPSMISLHFWQICIGHSELEDIWVVPCYIYAGEDASLTHTPTMSNVPTGNPFVCPKDTFDFMLNSIIATIPAKREATIMPYLCTFIAHPVIAKLISQGKAPAPVDDAPPIIPELKQIQDTLGMLSKAVECLSKGNPPSKNPSPSTRKKQKGGESKPQPPRTYSAVAGSRPPNPSLVVDLAHMEFPDGSRPRPESICEVLNKKLGEVTPPQAQLAAVRWTAKGNLVITAGPSSSPVSLLSAAPHINAILSTTLKLPSHSPFTQPRANIKWSKITINGVPTGASSTRNPYTPEECHAALAAINPTYTSLQITQKPSWVRPPSSYNHGSASSLSVAFEDPDGSKAKTLLAERYLYAFGNRASTKKWKYRLQQTKDKSETNVVEHDQDDDPPDDEDVKPTFKFSTPLHPASTVHTPLPLQSNQPPSQP